MAKLPLSPDQAKAKVFEHWKNLEALAHRRFPKDRNLADEALNHVLDNLQAYDWKRVCSWEGEGRFLAFITTLTTRLLTDFSRHKFGHIRKPSWLEKKNDVVWHKAYRLLIVEKYSRQEAIEMLLAQEPQRQRWFAEEVVSVVISNCKQPVSSASPSVSIDAVAEQPDFASQPDNLLMIKEDEIIETLRRYLDQDDDSEPPQRVSELIARLRESLKLSEEDLTLLRLRYIDGMNMQAIARMLSLHGDLYKRYNKIINHIRKACRQTGLLDD